MPRQQNNHKKKKKKEKKTTIMITKSRKRQNPDNQIQKKIPLKKITQQDNQISLHL